jgi:hypothetical protein
MKEGAWSLDDLVNWRVISQIIAEGSHLMCSTYLDLNFYSHSQGFGGHI